MASVEACLRSAGTRCLMQDEFAAGTLWPCRRRVYPETVASLAPWAMRMPPRARGNGSASAEAAAAPRRLRMFLGALPGMRTRCRDGPSVWDRPPSSEARSPLCQRAGRQTGASGMRRSRDWRAAACSARFLHISDSPAPASQATRGPECPPVSVQRSESPEPLRCCGESRPRPCRRGALDALGRPGARSRTASGASGWPIRAALSAWPRLCTPLAAKLCARQARSRHASKTSAW
jgi:hypothetical protein